MWTWPLSAAVNDRQVADNVDKEYTILSNGQVAAQQRVSKHKIPEPVHPPVRRSRSVSPAKPRGIFGGLCSRFRSPSKRDQRAKSRLDQASAVAAFRDTYGAFCHRSQATWLPLLSKCLCYSALATQL